MKTLDDFIIKLIASFLVVLLFHHFDFVGILSGLETIYVSLARTIDPSYTLSLFAQNGLVWLAGIVALGFIYR
jgi:hypothetical protein